MIAAQNMLSALGSVINGSWLGPPAVVAAVTAKASGLRAVGSRDVPASRFRASSKSASTKGRLRSIDAGRQLATLLHAPPCYGGNAPSLLRTSLRLRNLMNKGRQGFCQVATIRMLN